MLTLVISTNKKAKPPGFVLLLVVAVMGGLLFLAGYFLEQSTSEIKIAKSESAATKTYYLAEAAINEGIYKIKNDTTWKNKFLAGTLSGDTITHTGVFDGQGSYTITASSVSGAMADITATATYSIGDQQTRRVIKARMARAVDPAFSWNQSMYAGGWGGQQNGNITIERDCLINGGRLHANQNVKVTSSSDLTINDAQITSSNNIIVNAGSNLILNNSTQNQNVPTIAMPAVDFDSSSATSLKNRASQIYTATQFANLPSGTVLNGITFVTGNATWTDKNLTINGILATSGSLIIDLDDNKNLTVNSNTTGSGLLSKSNLILETDDTTSVVINGLIYSSSAMTLEVEDSTIFNVTGGIIGWHVILEGDDTGTCSLTYDGTLVAQPLDPVYNLGESPIIEVNHWEEQY